LLVNFQGLNHVAYAWPTHAAAQHENYWFLPTDPYLREVPVNGGPMGSKARHKQMEWAMSFSKIFTAGLLSVAVVGGAAAYMSTSLAQSPSAKVAVDGYVIEQPQPQPVRHAEVIVTEGWAS
jgi:hypothetical protein